MTILNPPAWQQSRTDHSARLYRRVISAILGTRTTSGVARLNDGTAPNTDLAVAPGTGLAVTVAPGSAFIAANTGLASGHYVVTNDANATSVTLGTANATNPRYDLVALRVRDDEYGHPTAQADLVVIAGTPAASPVEPAVPADGFYLVLARVTVAANASTVTAGQITDRRVFIDNLAELRSALTAQAGVLAAHDHRPDGTQGKPLGVLATAQATVVNQTLLTSETDITGATVTVDAVAGRSYLIVAEVSQFASAGTAVVHYQITATRTGYSAVTVGVAQTIASHTDANYGGSSATRLWQPSWTATHTIKVRAQVVQQTGSVYVSRAVLTVIAV